MSKQSEAKEFQCYRRTPNTCGNCAHYESQFERKSYGAVSWDVEKGMRCTLGGFAVKKSATCNLHLLAVGEGRA